MVRSLEPSLEPPEDSVEAGFAAAGAMPTVPTPRPTPPNNTPAVIAQLITAARRRDRFTRIPCHKRAPRAPEFAELVRLWHTRR